MPLSLLDTDALSVVLKQKHPVVVHKASAYLQHYQEFAFSAVTRYEVVRGLKTKNATRQLQQFATFCQHSLLFAVTDAILDRAADLWVAADKAGLPKNDADLLLAATALEHRRILVTGNTGISPGFRGSPSRTGGSRNLLPRGPPYWNARCWKPSTHRRRRPRPDGDGAGTRGRLRGGPSNEPATTSSLALGARTGTSRGNEARPGCCQSCADIVASPDVYRTNV
jgi:tRNA(fMet)-specific endonuclease VapC